MAYDKHTWTCDEPITVERLNHIEDGIANAGGDCGYECEEEIVTLTEESVTTEASEDDDSAYGNLSYSQYIDADTITVTFNGTEYECPRISADGDSVYGGFADGAPDFSEYPFAIGSYSGYGNTLATQTAGTYTIKIEGTKETITTTPCFEKAVQKVTPPTDISPLILTRSGSPAQLSRTFKEIGTAYLSGRTVLLDPPNVSNLKVTSGKSYYSMVSLEMNSAIGDVSSGGKVVFGGQTIRTFSAASASDYPVEVE